MKSPSVQTTKDYGLFKILGANRDVKKAQVNALVVEIKQKGQLMPIIVNGKNEVIDGQHRLEACRILGVPVQFLRRNGTTISEVQSMNNTQKPWGFSDFLKSYSHESHECHEEYQKVQKLMNQYGLSISIAIFLLTQNFHDYGRTDFKKGKFKVKSLSWAETQASYYKEMKGSNEHINNKLKFVTSFCRLQRLAEFDALTAVSQLKKFGVKFVNSKCTTTEEYMEAIIKAYNYLLRPKRKHISLKKI
jgi:hypothetical protein